MQSAPDPAPPRPEQLQALSLALFDGTRALHELSDASRHILETAAIIIEEPFPAAKKKPRKAAYALVEKLVVEELTPEEKKVLAAVLALTHNQVKKKALGQFDLSPAQQRETLTIAAILRIAMGLDDSHSASTTIQHIEPTRNGLWIVIAGEQAVSDAQAAQRGARLWAKIGYPPVTVMETAEAALKLLPFPSPDEAIELSSGDPLAEAGRKIMRYHFAQVIKHEPGTRLGEDIEALHDMRVATRRLRASFEVFQDAFEPGALKPYLKGLRAAGRALGSVRDLDVFIEKAQRYLNSRPPDQREDLSLLLRAWEAQRQQARQAMLVFMDSPGYAIFKREFNTFLQTPGAGVQPVPAGQPFPNLVYELAPVLIFSRLAEVLAYDPLLPGAPIERLHALRIEFKKLRYTTEYFRGVLGPEAKEVIEAFKTIQDHLGDLHDADVAAILLQEFIDQAEAQPTSDPEQLEFVRHYLHYCTAERQRLMETFPALWEQFKQPDLRHNLAKAIAAL